MIATDDYRVDIVVRFQVDVPARGSANAAAIARIMAEKLMSEHLGRASCVDISAEKVRLI